MKTFRLPDLGEGLREAEIVKWLVARGDRVDADQPLVAVETDKAVVELPSPYAGRIVELYAKAGDIVPTGAPLVEIDDADGEVVEPSDSEEGQRDRPATAQAGQAAEAAVPSADAGTVVGRIERTREAALVDRPGPAAKPSPVAAARAGEPLPHARAVPAVRMLARRLGVDLQAIAGSGPGGAITHADVERAASGAAGVTDGDQRAKSGGGEITEGYEPLRGPRRAMARNMSRAHAEVAAATVSDDASLRLWPPGVDTTVRLIRAIATACKTAPELNAWYDGAARARMLHDRLDLGVAVDTADGLFVPVLRNADSCTPEQLREELETLHAAVAARTIGRELLGGQTLTLSNFGTIGGRYASLVIVPPQVAIVGAGRIEERAVVRDGALSPERMLPLSVSFDHRAVSGGEASRFLAALIADLERAS